MTSVCGGTIIIFNRRPTTEFLGRVKKSNKSGVKFRCAAAPKRKQDLSHDSGVEFGLHEMTTKDTRPNYLFFVALRAMKSFLSARMLKGLRRCRKLDARRGDFNDGCLAL